MVIVLQVVYMARDPKDAVVSYYNFSRVMKLWTYTGTIDNFVRQFMNNERK